MSAAMSKEWIQWMVQLISIKVASHVHVGTAVFCMGKVYALLLANNATSARVLIILQGCEEYQEDMKQVNTVDDHDSVYRCRGTKTGW